MAEGPARVTLIVPVGDAESGSSVCGGAPSAIGSAPPSPMAQGNAAYGCYSAPGSPIVPAECFPPLSPGLGPLSPGVSSAYGTPPASPRRSAAAVRVAAERAMAASPGVRVRSAAPSAGVVIVDAHARGAAGRARDDVFRALRLGDVSGGIHEHEAAIVQHATGCAEFDEPEDCGETAAVVHIEHVNAAAALGRAGEFALRAALVHGARVDEDGRVQVASCGEAPRVAVRVSARTRSAVAAVLAELRAREKPGHVQRVPCARRALDWLLSARLADVRRVALARGATLCAHLPNAATPCTHLPNAEAQCTHLPNAEAQCTHLPNADESEGAVLAVCAGSEGDAAAAAAAVDEMLFCFHSAAVWLPLAGWRGPDDAAHAALLSAAAEAAEHAGVEAAVERSAGADGAAAVVAEVFGAADAVAAALATLCAAAGPAAQVRWRLRAAESIRDFVCGKKDGKLVKIMKETGVSLALQPRTAAGRAYLDAELVGSDGRAVAAALEMLRGEFPAELSFFLAESHHKRLIGHGGKTIQRVMKAFAVYVKFLSGAELADSSAPGEHGAAPAWLPQGARPAPPPPGRVPNVIVRTPAKNAHALAAARDAILNMADEDERAMHTRVLFLSAHEVAAVHSAALRRRLLEAMQRAVSLDALVFALLPAEAAAPDALCVSVCGDAQAVARFLAGVRPLAPLVVSDSETQPCAASTPGAHGPLTVREALRQAGFPVPAWGAEVTREADAQEQSPVLSPAARPYVLPHESPILASRSGAFELFPPASPPASPASDAGSWSGQSPDLFRTFPCSVLHVPPLSAGPAPAAPLSPLGSPLRAAWTRAPVLLEDDVCAAVAARERASSIPASPLAATASGRLHQVLARWGARASSQAPAADAVFGHVRAFDRAVGPWRKTLPAAHRDDGAGLLLASPVDPETGGSARRRRTSPNALRF